VAFVSCDYEEIFFQTVENEPRWLTVKMIGAFMVRVALRTALFFWGGGDSLAQIKVTVPENTTAEF
jgi:hypothetical protein